ncbi:MAG TPA: Nif3-like dinuclear metal center hexameric protein [Bacillota bacterium]|nr:Nif3-like dinuclear metal center hexameric protein [Bacillota bacterium]HOL15788.1 Nif3-like dinuclear metal center hexameric protein [Bacillota bacterium]HPZ12067.1 Nif3-like dinuclear metal center hexameric protein [Bacillota bacterium]HQE10651.1 Nif3-like dinuclear metal center hexameric protein [Bacillota bacterium]
MLATVKQITGFIEELAPPALALPGDPVGLQLGDPYAEVGKALVALELDEAVLEEAAAGEAGLVVTHHPLLFEPLSSLDESMPHGALIAAAIRRRIAVYSAHTNLDVSPRGVNHVLAGRIGLAGEGRRPLKVTGHDRLLKLAVFVPSGHEEQMLAALAAAGAGSIGRYSHCSFQVSGTGTFMPLEGSDPFIGRRGRLEKVGEKRLEMILPASRRDAVVRALLEAHPYEEPAYDLYSLELEGEPFGLGLIGMLEVPSTLNAIAERCRKELGLRTLRCWAPPGRRFKQVALCGGSGGSLIEEAAAQGAELFISGDFRYHDLKKAQAYDLALVDAGHGGTEQPVVGYLVEYLNSRLQEAGFKTVVAAAETSPSDWFSY